MAKAKSTEQPAQSNNIKWTLVKRQLSELKPYPKNPRTITEQGLKDLKKSVDKFGLAEPIIINTDNTIIGGHARYLTLKNNNAVECDCYLPSRKLNAKEVEELNIRLNKNIAGLFDFDILANEFDTNKLLEWGFNERELGGISIEKINELNEWENSVIDDFEINKENEYRLHLIFGSEKKRKDFVEKHKIKLGKGQSGVWTANL